MSICEVADNELYQNKAHAECCRPADGPETALPAHDRNWTTEAACAIERAKKTFIHVMYQQKYHFHYAKL